MEPENLLLCAEQSTTDPHMGQINLVYIVTLQFFRIHFNIIHTNNHHLIPLSYTSTGYKCLLRKKQPF
jgi:hypothetical protein